jgi:phospholipid transport system substrate-binding protein
MKNLIFLVFFAMAAACSGNSGPASAPSAPAAVPASPVPASDTIRQSEAALSSDPAVSEPAPIPVDEARKKMSPMESIKDLDKQIEAYHLGQELTQKQIDENIVLKQKIIRGTFDIEELCRLALAKHWDEITADQRKHFVELMTHLLEKKAIFSKEQLHGENKYYTINYVKETIEAAGGEKSVVNTRMVIPKRKMDLDLTYKLIKKPDGWKIFDVIVDDASLLSNYKFQFDRIIQKGGFADLIKRMETKLESIGKED